MSKSMYTDTDKDTVKRVYRNRFQGNESYRIQVWKVLVNRFFQSLIEDDDVVLDLGCGYGEFINRVRCRLRFAMDLNPGAREWLDPAVIFLEHDCSSRWTLEPRSLDLVFSSNFFEHLPSRDHLLRTLGHAFEALKTGGILVALGPNIRYIPGAYWDFFDHYLPLSDASLCEAMRIQGFEIERVEPKFLPYTMSGGNRYPLPVIEIYLAIPILWKIFGKQFLVIARKPPGEESPG